MFYAEQGCTIVTGNAHGADQSFALGANMVSPALVELCLPWQMYNHHAIILPVERHDANGRPDGEYPGNTVLLADHASPEQRAMAERAHSAWANLKDGTRRLLTRNALICHNIQFLLAHPNLQKDGWGGTGHTMRIAAMLGIPVWMTNLWKWWNPADGQGRIA